VIKFSGRAMMVEGSSAPAVKCSYCRRLIQPDDSHDMGFESDDWAICFKCFRKVCDKIWDRVKLGLRVRL